MTQQHTLATSQILDLIGMRCPAPIVKLNAAIKEAQPGAEFNVLANDPAFELDIKAWCRRTGHELLAFHALTDHASAHVRKK